jgi:hypothetical protein
MNLRKKENQELDEHWEGQCKKLMWRWLDFEL